MAYRKLNRASGNRKALFRSLSSALILNGRIETTIAKAKETSKNVAKLITLAPRSCLTNWLLNTRSARAALPAFTG